MLGSFKRSWSRTNGTSAKTVPATCRPKGEIAERRISKALGLFPQRASDDQRRVGLLDQSGAGLGRGRTILGQIVTPSPGPALVG